MDDSTTHETYNDILSAALREIWEERGLSADIVANSLGVSRATIYNWLNAGATGEKVDQLLVTLGAHPWELIRKMHCYVD